MQPRRKILVLASVFPAVSETFVVDHVVGLARCGWDVVVAAWKIEPNLLNVLHDERSPDLPVRLLNTEAASRPRRIGLALRRLLFHYPGGLLSPWVRDLAIQADAVLQLGRSLRPDVIHAHFGPNGIVAAFAARRLGIPLIVDFHGYDVTVVPKQHGWQPYRRLLAGALGIAHSSFVGDRVREHVGIPVRRVTLGVDPYIFKAPRRKNRWPRHIRLLTVGRLVWQKGHHVALEALALLRQRLPEHEFSLRICGEGELREYLRERARMLSVEDQVEITGGISHGNVAAAMREADILFVPSVPRANGWQEAFCRVAVEGMAMGLPVVGTDTGGLAETIGKGGFVVPPGNAQGMAEVVSGILEGSVPDELASMALAHAKSFSIETMWRQYDEISHQAYRC